jgi:hypothetical protein
VKAEGVDQLYSEMRRSKLRNPKEEEEGKKRIKQARQTSKRDEARRS